MTALGITVALLVSSCIHVPAIYFVTITELDRTWARLLNATRLPLVGICAIATGACIVNFVSLEATASAGLATVMAAVSVMIATNWKDR